MVKFYEDLANNGVVGRYYVSNGAKINGAEKSKGLIAKVTSLDVAYREVHYTLFFKRGREIGRFSCPIEQVTVFDRASEHVVERIEAEVANSGTRLYRKVFPA